MAKDPFIKYKDSKGAVTVVKRGGKYDEGPNPRYSDELNETFRGQGASASASVIAKPASKRAPDVVAGTMRNATKKAQDKSTRDAEFFSHHQLDNKKGK